ncbi:putative RING-H2 finger protein ATL21A [Camellia lanceoleosa]|uniref:RING-H2 finger protein ATL21A n=1 Tax=Camellia lanceoleosa TaxID=1840588 RepID=A0ACC0H4V5_9ERIC|nr:putative RING-H2 finger protein ATL21A [Camellia lanceoleosa]
MAIFHGILLLIVLLFVPMAAAATVGLGGGAEEQDLECLPTRCREHHGPEIRFPFRLIGKQPEHCGYHPGFDLSCIPHSKYPLLQLPFSVNVFVNNIDYKSQTIDISDPNRCLPRQLQNFNLSASPFPEYHGWYYDLSFVNCSRTQDLIFDGVIWIACLSDQSHQVYAIQSQMKPALSCTKMYSISLPVDVQAQDIIDGFRLKWSKPVCGDCEAQGKYCRLKNNNNSNNNNSGSDSQLLLNGSTECFDKPRQQSMGALPKLKIAGEMVHSIIIQLSMKRQKFTNMVYYDCRGSPRSNSSSCSCHCNISCLQIKQNEESGSSKD